MAKTVIEKLRLRLTEKCREGIVRKKDQLVWVFTVSETMSKTTWVLVMLNIGTGSY